MSVFVCVPTCTLCVNSGCGKKSGGQNMVHPDNLLIRFWNSGGPVPAGTLGSEVTPSVRN